MGSEVARRGASEGQEGCQGCQCDRGHGLGGTVGGWLQSDIPGARQRQEGGMGGVKAGC